MPAQPSLVTITINGVKFQIPPGTATFSEIAALAGKKVNKITVVSGAPAQAGSINGNDSFPVMGGEVLTTS